MEGNARAGCLVYMALSFALFVAGVVLMFTLPEPLPYIVPIVVVPFSIYLARRYLRPAETPPHRERDTTRDRS